MRVLGALVVRVGFAHDEVLFFKFADELRSNCHVNSTGLGNCRLWDKVTIAWQPVDGSEDYELWIGKIILVQTHLEIAAPMNRLLPVFDTFAL